MGKKIGLNEPCPCGSGKKYKKCHGSVHTSKVTLHTDRLPEEVRRQFEQQGAAELQRQEQQGLGKPIISTLANGVRYVAVGSGVHYSPKWKTFHDFLHYYIKTLFDTTWANQELKKRAEERHPLLVWYELAVRYQNQFVKEPGKISSAPTTGAVEAYLGLAYNLYLAAHNVEVQKDLLKRLMN